MKLLKKSITLFTAIVLFLAFITSCTSNRQVGCPGQDRPSFRGSHGMITPLNKEFNTLPIEKKATSYSINTMT